ncbi:T-cell surface antigen CD2-like isoform X2 [Anguilla anguilla]|uniref:T-cell surface antigen CD2-like isoform X2 n=1 Tax=Anguilla anguilla TaxID=7936 RepID=UPI0015A91BCE|nr:T-cell surface antigen CD2-like isoform X2 [Anguilla anguilla]
MRSMHPLPTAHYLQLVKRVAFHIMGLHICAQHVMAQNSSREFRQVGDTIFLHPARTRANVNDVRWKKSNGKTFKLHCGSECEIFENGSLLIKTASKNDTGNYTVESFNSSGRMISRTGIELIIIEAVSRPAVRSSCTLDGRVLLACSVDRGDRVRLQWAGLTNLSSLSPQPAQTETERTLYLFGSTPGHVLCVAENPVSKKSSRSTVKGCRGRIPACIAFGLFLSIPVCSVVLLKFHRKPAKDSEDMGENIYVTMQGFQDRRLEKQEKEFLDNSIYVTCESLRAIRAET